MTKGRIVCIALALFIVAGTSAAQDKKLPDPAAAPDKSAETPAAPAANPATARGCRDCGCAMAGMTPVPIAPNGPAPGMYYQDSPCSVRRHPFCLWLTYVPARRPYLTGWLCQKAPNCQPPLYDYFPCCFDQCHAQTVCAPKKHGLSLFHKSQCTSGGCTP
jgi:hypothetical protein